MKRIPLTQGQFAIVDDEDFEELSKYKWCVMKLRYGGFAAIRNLARPARRAVLMHRQIMNTPKGMDTDHINHNCLDNKKSNLRICTRSQNNANQKLQVNRTSKYKGVSWEKRRHIWRAYIQYKKKFIYLGQFNEEAEAAKAYDQKARELYGEFVLTNFRG